MKKYVNILKGFCVGNFMLMLSYIIIYLCDGNTVYMSEISKLTNFKFMLSQFISSGLTYVIVYATIILGNDLFKNDSENPTDETHREGEPAGGSRHAFEHDDDDVECDEDEEPDVEFLAGGGIGFEDDGVDLLLGERAEAFRKQDGEEGAVENVADEIDDLPEDFGVWDVDNPAEDGFNYFFHL